MHLATQDSTEGQSWHTFSNTLQLRSTASRNHTPFTRFEIIIKFGLQDDEIPMSTFNRVAESLHHHEWTEKQNGFLSQATNANEASFSPSLDIAHACHVG